MVVWFVFTSFIHFMCSFAYYLVVERLSGGVLKSSDYSGLSASVCALWIGLKRAKSIHYNPPKNRFAVAPQSTLKIQCL